MHKATNIKDASQVVTSKQGLVGIECNHTTTNPLRASSVAKTRTKEAPGENHQWCKIFYSASTHKKSTKYSHCSVPGMDCCQLYNLKDLIAKTH